jgi:hypothetical protein
VLTPCAHAIAASPIPSRHAATARPIDTSGPRDASDPCPILFAHFAKRVGAHAFAVQ